MSNHARSRGHLVSSSTPCFALQTLWFWGPVESMPLSLLIIDFNLGSLPDLDGGYSFHAVRFLSSVMPTSLGKSANLFRQKRQPCCELLFALNNPRSYSLSCLHKTLFSLAFLLWLYIGKIWEMASLCILSKATEGEPIGVFVTNPCLYIF